MLTYSIQTLEDAYELLERYELLTSDWGQGSASGFAAKLLVERPASVDAPALAAMLAEYQAQGNNAALAQTMDAALVRQATAIRESIEAARASRWRVGEFVRKAKYSHAAGPWAWKLVAELATMRPAHRLELRPRLQPGFLAHAAALLHGLAALAGDDLFDFGVSYTPGDDELLDAFVRVDIERLDAPLATRPWPNGPQADACAIAALFSLARDTAFLASVAVLHASAASKAETASR
jgi:hypothetical protein